MNHGAERSVLRSSSWLMALACAGCFATVSIKAADEPATGTVPQTSAPLHRASALEQRVALLSAELGLDAQQQAEVRRILEDQRQQVAKVWSDTAVPAAYRVNATRSISERTGDRIRALLTEEQKAKYNQPRKPREAAEHSDAPSVEDWMKATNSK
jgi:protein CpxP